MRKVKSNTPNIDPINEKVKDVPARIKPTGYPVSKSPKVKVINRMSSEYSVMTLA
tara:strand:+ start:148 stop:312 length:165 start_codon:yes stop_codon:yes gene_type:complete